MAFTYKATQQGGSIKRVMCCTTEERKRYNDQLLSLMPTRIAPSYATNPRTGVYNGTSSHSMHCVCLGIILVLLPPALMFYSGCNTQGQQKML